MFVTGGQRNRHFSNILRTHFHLFFCLLPISIIHNIFTTGHGGILRIHYYTLKRMTRLTIVRLKIASLHLKGVNNGSFIFLIGPGLSITRHMKYASVDLMFGSVIRTVLPRRLAILLNSTIVNMISHKGTISISNQFRIKYHRVLHLIIIYRPERYRTRRTSNSRYDCNGRNRLNFGQRFSRRARSTLTSPFLLNHLFSELSLALVILKNKSIPGTLFIFILFRGGPHFTIK